MSKPDYTVKQNDVKTRRFHLTNPDGTNFNPTGWTLSFFFQELSLDPATDPSQTGAGSFAVVGDGSGGLVDYTNAAADYAVVSNNRLEIEALIGAQRETFPDGGYIRFDVIADLGNG